jgi:hypothetical protein
MTLHGLVEAVVGAYLRAVDAEAAGLLEGLYLVGSVALGDFHPHTSDIDFVAVTRSRPDAAALAALARVHAQLRDRRRRPFFDGLYVTRDDLARDPTRAGPRPHSHEGRFHAAGTGPPTPVTWHTLARHGLTCRGPAPADLGVWADPEALAAWSVGNLDSYWRRWLDRASRPLSRSGAFALGPSAAVWGSPA